MVSVIYKSDAHNHPCMKCGAPADRYCLGEDSEGNIDWGYMCLECRPYDDIEGTKKGAQRSE